MMEEEDKESEIAGVGAVDLFIDEANPLGRNIHSSLETVKKKMEKRDMDKGGVLYMKLETNK